MSVKIQLIWILKPVVCRKFQILWPFKRQLHKMVKGAICYLLFAIYLTIFWGWRLKGSRKINSSLGYLQKDHEIIFAIIYTLVVPYLVRWIGGRVEFIRNPKLKVCQYCYTTNLESLVKIDILRQVSILTDRKVGVCRINLTLFFSMFL